MIRLALIGCGGMGMAHCAGFKALSDRVTVATTVDVDLERAKVAAGTLNAGLAATDYREALDDCDAVLIALPHHLHHPVGLDCLRAGKHVLMEKPLANTEPQCLDLIQEAERQGRVLMVAYCMRFHPLVIRLKELIDSRTYGDTFHVSIWTEQLTEVPRDHWGARAETLGGGQLFSHGCHYVDLLLYFLGAPVSGFHVGTNLGTPWMEREGTSDLSIRFETGAVGYHGATWGARGTRLGYAIQAHMTGGMLEADLDCGRLTLIRGGQEETLLATDGTMKFLERELAHFLDCVETGSRTVTDGPDSLQGLRVIWRLYEAEKEARAADLRGLGLKAR